MAVIRSRGSRGRPGPGGVPQQGNHGPGDAGLPQAVPTLRRVISFDPADGVVTLFGDLLAGAPAAQQLR